MTTKKAGLVCELAAGRHDDAVAVAEDKRDMGKPFCFINAAYVGIIAADSARARLATVKT